MPKLVTVIGLLAALIFIAASAMTNFVFASSLGKTQIEGHILGAVSVAADMFKAILPLIIVHAFRTTRYGVMLWGSLLFVVVLVFSFTSALGLIASNRSGVVGARAVSAERGVQIARELAGIETLHKGLPVQRWSRSSEQKIRVAKESLCRVLGRAERHWGEVSLIRCASVKRGVRAAAVVEIEVAPK
jgi:hypothetical protein